MAHPLWKLLEDFGEHIARYGWCDPLSGLQLVPYPPQASADDDGPGDAAAIEFVDGEWRPNTLG